jgi:serine/threonine protein kinase
VPIPTRIGRYAIRRRIGSGGFATVWLGYDESLDSPVAIKVLAENWSDDHHVKQRFVDEGRFLRKVESPYVVPVYDAGELDDGRPYLVMGYADQGTLADRLAATGDADATGNTGDTGDTSLVRDSEWGGGLTREEALEVVRQVGLGLTALHQRGVVHRDVKPGNVLFRTVEGSVDHGVNDGANDRVHDRANDRAYDGTNDGRGGRGGRDRAVEVRAMVGDLGLGKTVDVSSRLTMIAGTPTFVAPEQAQGERIDARADQYSLAALCYLLLTGRPPHRHTTLAAAASPGEPDPMSTPEWPVPAAVEAVVRRGLAADPQDRWPDVASFTAALAHAAGTSDPGPAGKPRVLPIDPDRTLPGARPSPLTRPAPLAPPTPPRARRRRAAAVAAVAVVLLAAGGVGGYAAWQVLDSTTTISDSRSALTVTVPDGWDRAAATDGWQPPDTDTTYPALSVGSSTDWETDGGEGVFVGVLPGSKLPTSVPGHPECRSPEDVIDDDRDGDPSMTVYFTDCPSVTVERVVQVAANRLLWVQVRADSRSTAVAVLDSVTTHGL